MGPRTTSCYNAVARPVSSSHGVVGGQCDVTRSPFRSSNIMTTRLDDLRALLRDDVVMTTDVSIRDDATASGRLRDSGQRISPPNADTASPHLRAVIVPFAGVPARDLRTGRPLSDMCRSTICTTTSCRPPRWRWPCCCAAAKFVVPIDRELRTGDWRSRYAETPVALLQRQDGAHPRLWPDRPISCPHLPGNGHERHRRAPRSAGAGRWTIVEVYPPGALHQLLPQANVAGQHPAVDT